jgi:Protein of unknown function (DUF3108)
MRVACASVCAFGAALAACGGAASGLGHPDAAAHLAEAAQPILGLEPGEAMSFEVRLGGILAGEAQLAVGQPGRVDGHRAITVRSRIATAGAVALFKAVSDEATTVIDLDRAAPIQMISDVTVKGVDYHAVVAFHGPTIEVSSSRSNHDGVSHRRFAFGTVVGHDTHSAMAAMRGWDVPPGTVRTLWVMGGKRIWKSRITFAGRETIHSRFGNRAAVRLDGIAWRALDNLKVNPHLKPREFSVWLSDDADRVPLRVVARTELGNIVIELTDYHRP